jgi:3-oxoacyl-[acyl-carrier protein] reductase
MSPLTAPRADLEGRTALVTGGSSDIGMATARALASRGADVAIHCHAGVDKAEGLRKELEALGRQATVIRADLTLHDETRRLAAEAQAFAPIDILINNAGHVVRRVHWMELDPAHLDRVFGLNYRAPLYLVQSLSPAMVERGRGVVINLLSTAAWGGGSNTAFAYGSAKGALHTLTQALARELAPKGVRVLAVSPGTIDSAFQREPGNVALWKQWVGNIPVGRIGRPDEIGEVVAFLATDAASFIVGETIHVNGGIFMS